jgi:hypothetical protein
MTKYFVINENILGYQQPGQRDIGVLASSIIRGATVSWRDGCIAMPMNPDTMRPATIADFESFMVHTPPDFGKES